MSSGPIEFSLTLPRYQDLGERDPYRRTYEFAHHVESIGYAGGFVGHHSFTPETKDPSAPFVLLSAIAARTERLRLGTGVFLGALHHPVNICEQVSTRRASVVRHEVAGYQGPGSAGCGPLFWLHWKRQLRKQCQADRPPGRDGSGNESRRQCPVHAGGSVDSILPQTGDR